MVGLNIAPSDLRLCLCFIEVCPPDYFCILEVWIGNVYRSFVSPYLQFNYGLL